MKTIGLIGGMSWESSLEYYRVINEETKLQLGDTHSAECLMYSFDFHYVDKLQHKGDWKKLTDEMVKQASNLKKAGAEFIVICTNTMHLMAGSIEEKTGLKVLHIADAAGEEIKRKGLTKVALLGTKFTMQGDFYKSVLRERHNIEVIVPNESDMMIIHNIIYKELILGKIDSLSKMKYVEIINKLQSEGAQGVILGCTEIPLLVKQEDVSIPVFDTATIHSKAAVRYSLTK